MLCIGFYMVGLPRGLPFKSDLINFHKSLGITVFLLVLIRILVRLAYGRPPLPPMRTWQRAAASITQALLYAGMVAMPLTGYLGSSFNKFGTKLLGHRTAAMGLGRQAVAADLSSASTRYLAWIMAALVILHFLGAMKHQLIDRDGLLRRMLP